MIDKTKATAEEAATQANTPIIPSNGEVKKSIKTMQYIKHSLTAAIAGKTELSEDKWLKLYQPLINECSNKLSELGGKL